jgi:hypothetical protein
MTIRYVGGLAIVALLLVGFGSAVGYWAYGRKEGVRRQRRRKRRKSRTIRIDEFMIRTNEAEPDQRAN